MSAVFADESMRVMVTMQNHLCMRVVAVTSVMNW